MYNVSYYVNGREVSANAATYTRAHEKAARVAINSQRPFPIVIKDDLGVIIDKINS